MIPVAFNGALPGEEIDGIAGPLGTAVPPKALATEIPATAIPLCGPRGGKLRATVDAQMASLNDGDTGLHRKKGYVPTCKEGLQNEAPWMLMAAYMFAMKRTISEVAMAAGVSKEAVSILRAQKWFQQRLAQIANNQGDEITSAFHAHALESVERIADLAANGDSERVRLAANQIIVEQAVGKPVQKTLTISGTMSTGLTPKEEYDRTQEELRVLRASRNS